MKNERSPVIDKSIYDILELLFTQDFYRNFNPRNYPPYNIIHIEDDAQAGGGNGLYRIDVAVAGFSASDIAVNVDDCNTLLISGAKIRSNEKGKTFIHRGISQRAFQLKFKLSPDVEVMVSDVVLEDGILSVGMRKKDPIGNKVKIKVKGSNSKKGKPQLLVE